MAAVKSVVTVDVDHLYSFTPGETVPGEAPLVTCFNTFLRDPLAQITSCKLQAIPGKGIEIRNRDSPEQVMEEWYWNQVTEVKHLGANHFMYNNVLAIITGQEIHLFNVPLPTQAVNVAAQLNGFLVPSSPRPTMGTPSIVPPQALPQPGPANSSDGNLSVDADHLYSHLLTALIPGQDPTIACFNAFLTDKEAKAIKCKLVAVPNQGLEIYDRDPPENFLEGWYWGQIKAVGHIAPNHIAYNNVLGVTTETEVHIFNIVAPVQAAAIADQLQTYFGSPRASSVVAVAPRPTNVEPSKTPVVPPALPPPLPGSPSSPPQQLVPIMVPMAQNPPPLRLSDAKRVFRIRVDRDQEADVLKKCLDEVEFFADQRLVQYYSAMNELNALNKRESELQIKVANKKTKSSDRKQAKSESEQITERIHQLKSFTDSVLPTAEELVGIIQKIRLAFMLLTRLRRFLLQTLPPEAPFETMVGALMDRFLAIAAQANNFYPPPFAILNDVSMPLFTREDIQLIRDVVEQKGNMMKAFWEQLGTEHWKTAVEDWQHEIVFYKPKFQELPDPIELRFLDPAVIRQWISESKLRESQTSAAQARMEASLQQRFRQQLLTANKKLCKVVDARKLDRKVHFLVEPGEILEFVAEEGDDVFVRNVDGASGLVPMTAIELETVPDQAEEEPEDLLLPAAVSPRSSELDLVAQISFKTRLLQEGKRIGTVVKDSRNEADNFHVSEGEVVEILNKVGFDEVRVRRMNGTAGVVASDVIVEDDTEHGYSNVQPLEQPEPLGQPETQPKFIAEEANNDYQQFEPKIQEATSMLSLRDQDKTRGSSLDPTQQNAFKNQLMQEGKTVCFVTNVAIIDPSLNIQQGEVLEFVREVGRDESQVRTADDRVEQIPKDALAIFPRPSNQVSQTRSDSAVRPSVQTAAEFKARLERDRKRFAVAITATKDQNSNNVVIYPGEVLEVLDDVSESQVRVSNCFGSTLIAKKRSLMIPQSPRATAPQQDVKHPSTDRLPSETSKPTMLSVPDGGHKKSSVSPYEVQQDEFARKIRAANGILCRALEDFAKSSEGHLSVQKGEYLEAQSKQRDVTQETWVVVSNYIGGSGFVPGQILEQETFFGTRRTTTKRDESLGGSEGAYGSKPPQVSSYSKRKSQYSDVQQIAVGSFGAITLVTRLRDNRQLVIKETVLNGRNDEMVRTKTTFLAKYPHKGFIEVTGYFEESGKIYVEMPNYYEISKTKLHLLQHSSKCSVLVVPGLTKGTLRKAINKKLSEPGAHFAEDQIKTWLSQLSKAIQHVHGYKIIHGDIKAENVFLTSDNAVKLGDLNSAELSFESTRELVNTTTADGTLPYIAPEMCIVGQRIDTKVDIWALGVLAYFLAALRLPYGEDISIITKLTAKPPKHPRALPSSYSRDFAQLISILLTHDPVIRPNIKQVLAARFLQ